MSHVQLSRTKPVQEAWQDITQEKNDAQTTAIYDAIGKNGGDVEGLFGSQRGVMVAVYK